MSVFLLILKIFGLVLAGIVGLILLMLLVLLLVPYRYRLSFTNREEMIRGRAEVSFLLSAFRVSVSVEGKEFDSELRVFWIFRKKPLFSGKGEKKKESEKEKKPETEKEKKPLRDTVSEWKEKITKARSLLTDPAVQTALSATYDRFVRIMRSVMPKKCTGEVVYGLSDPSGTGRVTAFLATTLPIHKNPVSLVPDFEKSVFSADVTAGGRILVAVILYHVLCLFANRNVRYAWKCLKKEFGKKKETVKNG